MYDMFVCSDIIVPTVWRARPAEEPARRTRATQKRSACNAPACTMVMTEGGRREGLRGLRRTAGVGEGLARQEKRN